MGSHAARRTVASYVAPFALAPGARVALEALGYRMVAASALGRWDEAQTAVDLRLVDERYLERVGQDETPIVIVGRSRSVFDPRVVGTVDRPARIAGLYRLLQLALEPEPRRAARAPTRLPARCASADASFAGEIHTLSEEGCRLVTRAPLEAGLELELMFPPTAGSAVVARGRVVSLDPGSGAGISFGPLGPTARAAIANHVQRRLILL
jgi:hypothetical protein